MTELKTETTRLSDTDLDLVVGGLNPQPLPPGPGPELSRSFASFFSHFAINRFVFARFGGLHF